jgi:uracil-DNA glycosylase
VSSPSEPRSIAEILGYLRDLGYEHLYARRPADAAGPLGGGLRAAAAATSGDATADVGERAESLAALAAQAAGCTLCRLSQGRKSVVFGSGSPNADLMLIGEGPGAEEDRQGLPFVGPAGELLDKIIAAIGMRREEVYIANVVKCRPPQNRDPESDEAEACRRYLDGQIEAVRPKVIVALGRVAAHNLLNASGPLSRLRGQWFSVQGIATRVTYHPAALLRSASYKRPTWEDMQIVRDRVHELTGRAPAR